MYAELMRNHKMYRIKSLYGNKMHEDTYGKLRCCEYLPIAIAHFNEDGHIIEDIDITGLDFEDKYLVEYSGKVNNEDFDNYTLNFVRTVGIDREEIARRIFTMAKANWR